MSDLEVEDPAGSLAQPPGDPLAVRTAVLKGHSQFILAAMVDWQQGPTDRDGCKLSQATGRDPKKKEKRKTLNLEGSHTVDMLDSDFHFFATSI